MNELKVLEDIVNCADSWDYEACLIGNVKAGDIVTVCRNAYSLKSRCKELILAWEALPEGNHTPKEVESWLKNSMKPVMDRLRKD